MKLFAGKNVLVTGATSGLGRAVAIEFAKKGANVSICGRRIEEGKKVEDELRKLGVKAKFYVCDIDKEEDIKNLIHQTSLDFGSIDSAVNNAGRLGVMNNFIDYSLEEWEKVMKTNINGTMLCMRYEILEMLKVKKGSIVNVASVLGIVGGHFKVSAYAASKHAIVGMTKSVALEVAPKGIRVNVVCPGSIDSEMLDGIYVNVKPEDLQKVKDEQAKAYPMRRISYPEEVAKSIVFLASDEASFMTGVAMPVDGGWTAG
jgi:NAD(P)-dependent dehydrogenase (short-subunit alcohol dehydrogenase family)